MHLSRVSMIGQIKLFALPSERQTSHGGVQIRLFICMAIGMSSSYSSQVFPMMFVRAYVCVCVCRCVLSLCLAVCILSCPSTVCNYYLESLLTYFFHFSVCLFMYACLSASLTPYLSVCLSVYLSLSRIMFMADVDILTIYHAVCSMILFHISVTLSSSLCLSVRLSLSVYLFLPKDVNATSDTVHPLLLPQHQ